MILLVNFTEKVNQCRNSPREVEEVVWLDLCRERSSAEPNVVAYLLKDLVVVLS